LPREGSVSSTSQVVVDRPRPTGAAQVARMLRARPAGSRVRHGRRRRGHGLQVGSTLPVWRPLRRPRGSLESSPVVGRVRAASRAAGVGAGGFAWRWVVSHATTPAGPLQGAASWECAHRRGPARTQAAVRAHGAKDRPGARAAVRGRRRGTGGPPVILKNKEHGWQPMPREQAGRLHRKKEKARRRAAGRKYPAIRLRVIPRKGPSAWDSRGKDSRLSAVSSSAARRRARDNDPASSRPFPFFTPPHDTVAAPSNRRRDAPTGCNRVFRHPLANRPGLAGPRPRLGPG
jgi:hypothetical protein